MTDYKSVEQRLWDALPRKQIGELSQYFVKGLYGAVALLFRIPTFIRKCREDQTLADRCEVVWDQDTIAGSGWQLGIFIGSLTDMGVCLYSAVDLFQNKNYIPVAVLLGLNVASGLYELGRLGVRKRNEGLEVRVNQQQ
ncbi:hypothetical protein HYS50_00560 [Candidatus Woesearchaeota archaeon]|nr:hypothetical protein [Candidatus Woesearchaeota archaeon]